MGLEYRTWARERPQDFIFLIKKIKKIYRGKIGYQANWDDFEQIKFWRKLDFIGIGAYWPLGTEEDHTVETLEKGWGPILKKLENLSKENGRPVIFTEVGYRSCKGGHLGYKNPFKPYKKDWTCQENSYKAMFNALKSKNFVEGVYIWKYFTDPETYEKDNAGTDFMPNGKPAEAVFKSAFK